MFCPGKTLCRSVVCFSWLHSCLFVFVLPACPKPVNRAPFLMVKGIGTICTAVCQLDVIAAQRVGYAIWSYAKDIIMINGVKKQQKGKRE